MEIDVGEREPLHTVFFVSVPSFELGPQGRILRLSKAWAARGYPTAIAALQGDSLPGAREAALREVEIHRLTPHGKQILRAARFDAALAIRRFVARRRPKLVFALETLVDWHAKLALFDRDVPLVTLLGSDRWKWERKLYRRATFRALARRSNALIGNSQACLDGYRRALGARAVDPIPKAVLHNPVDPDEFTPRYERGGDEFVIGALGRLAEQKGFDLLLRAVAAMPTAIAGRRVRVVLQGSGPERDALGALARELGLADRVEFREHQRDVAPFFDAIQALAVPSRWAGFENSALEGMLNGVPTVCTPQTGLIELDDRRDLIFVDGHSDAIARELSRLAAASASERAGIARAQRERIIAQLSLERIANELEARLVDLGVLDAAEFGAR